MIIGGAQIAPKSGYIDYNISLHINIATVALKYNMDMLFFPELSITGYEPNMAAELAFEVNDERLNLLQRFVDSNGLMLGVGLPLKTQNGVQIVMAIFKENRQVSFYAKQYLHEDELPFFIPGDAPMILEIGTVKVMLAICYESLQPSHIEQKGREEIDLYLASVAKSENGIKKTNYQYPITAHKHNVPVMMVNAVGPCDNFVSAGQSGIWSATGELLAQMDSTTLGMVGFDTVSGHVITP